MLYQQGERWAVAGTNQPPKPDEGTLKLDAMEVRVEPRAEWRQMYREACRSMRDAFYDPGYHGLDMEALERRYEPYLQHLASRDDLSYLLAEMFGELCVSHAVVWGGDRPEVKRVSIGLLGADYRIENGRYRFSRIYPSDPWNPDVRGPLSEPGVSVAAGEYLLAVNGSELRASDLRPAGGREAIANLYRCFEGTAGKRVRLRVGPSPEGEGARDISVVPVDREEELRLVAWIEESRRKVDQMSGGRVGCVCLRDTWKQAYASFNRYFFAQTDREGLVIDERFNSGGLSPDHIILYLGRTWLHYWASRLGDDQTAPYAALPGPKAMIIDEYAGSGGDNLAWLFRRAGLGPLVGKRTWGGEVGTDGYFFPQLIDGGTVPVPNCAFYTPEGEWEVENHGVEPDIEVELDPQAWWAGRDPQLEAAVAWVLKELEKHPVPKLKRPSYPNYHTVRGRVAAAEPGK
jgi:tricorn protease